MHPRFPVITYASYNMSNHILSLAYDIYFVFIECRFVYIILFKNANVEINKLVLCK